MSFSFLECTEARTQSDMILILSMHIRFAELKYDEPSP